MAVNDHQPFPLRAFSHPLSLIRTGVVAFHIAIVDDEEEQDFVEGAKKGLGS